MPKPTMMPPLRLNLRRGNLVGIALRRTLARKCSLHVKVMLTRNKQSLVVDILVTEIEMRGPFLFDSTSLSTFLKLFNRFLVVRHRMPDGARGILEIFSSLELPNWSWRLSSPVEQGMCSLSSFLRTSLYVYELLIILKVKVSRKMHMYWLFFICMLL